MVSALLDELGDNVSIRCGEIVREIIPTRKNPEEEPGFRIEASDSSQEAKIISARRVILAAGGKSGPMFGTTGDGYSMARSLGHRVTRVYPILAGIRCTGADFQAIKGIRAKGCVTLLKDGEAIAGEAGEIQFTEDGISGICVFNLTCFMGAEEGENPAEAMKRYTLSIDLAPDFSQGELDSRKNSFGIVTRELADMISPEELKDWRLGVTGVKGWREAQAIIDVQGPCGGFNLQNAWETGIKAAKAAETSLIKR